MKRKLQNAIYGFIMVIALSACSPLNKPVTESLTPKEAESIAKKYDNFLFVYEDLIFRQVSKLPDKSLYKQKLEKLTYGDFMEFYNLVYENNWKKQLTHEWDEKYDEEKLNKQMDSMVDSLIAERERDRKENGIDTYVSIQLSEIKKQVENTDNIWQNGKKLKASARLKVVPLKKQLDELHASFTLHHTDGFNPQHVTLATQMASGKIKIMNSFNAPIEIECDLETRHMLIRDLKWHDYFCNTPVDAIKQKCILHLNINYAMIDGKKIDNEILLGEEPYYLSNYKLAREKGFSFSDKSGQTWYIYRREFIQKHIDREYDEKSDYIYKNVPKRLYQHNPLAFSLFYSEEFTERCINKYGWEPLE